MATVQPLPAASGAPHSGAPHSGVSNAGVSNASAPHPAGPRPGAAPGATAPSEPQQALIPAPQPQESEEEPAFPAPISLFPVSLGVSVPVRDFRVRQLLALAPGKVIETQWNHGEDLPLAAGQVQVAWSEFEVVDNRLAVRITRVA